LSGVIDIVTEDVVWEVKCVSELRAEHTMQLACYAWLWEKTQQTRGSRQFRLLNVRTGEVRQLTANSHDINMAVEALLTAKIRNEGRPTDEQFLKNAARLRAKFEPRALPTHQVVGKTTRVVSADDGLERQSEAFRKYQETYMQLTVKELKEMLRSQQLPVSGRKAELVKRLVEARYPSMGCPF